MLRNLVIDTIILVEESISRVFDEARQRGGKLAKLVEPLLDRGGS